mgnify:CR=1 FL=1
MKILNNNDTIYLNHFINCAQPGGIFEGLNNNQLREIGQELLFYAGVPEIFGIVPIAAEQDGVTGEIPDFFADCFPDFRGFQFCESAAEDLGVAAEQMRIIEEHF